MNVNPIIKNFNIKSASRLLKILLAIDIVFMVIHVCVRMFTDSWNSVFLIDTDNGVAENFEYIEYVMVVCFAGYLAFSKKLYGFLGWLFLFFFLFLEDCFEFHEHAGLYFAKALNFKSAFGLRPRDFGELTYEGFLGIFVFSAIGWMYYKGNEFFRKTSIDILLLFLLFLFFGVGVDMLAETVHEVHIVSIVFTLLEDGGEMIMLSVLVWYFYFIILKIGVERRFLFEFLLPKLFINRVLKF